MIISEFTKILEIALEAKIEEQNSNTAARRAHMCDPGIQNAIEELLSSPAYVPAQKLAHMYSEEREAKSPQPQRDLDKFLADELRLNPDLAADDLRRMRREYATHNHPDRVHPSERALATRRMSLVNALIDKALKEKTPQN